MASNNTARAEDEDEEKQEDTTSTPPGNATLNGAAGKGERMTPAKKRRKVNHACIYCRRSHMTCDLERPCTRCIKRNIGHLCHDEPREPAKRKSESGSAGSENDAKSKNEAAADGPLNALQAPNRTDTGLNLGNYPQAQMQTTNAPLVQPTPIPATAQPGFAGNSILGLQDWNFGTQSHLMQDMHTLHPQYMFNTSEVSNEYNLLNEFLSNSLLEDGALFNEDANANGMLAENTFNSNVSNLPDTMLAPMQQQLQLQQANVSAVPSQALLGNAISRPASGFPMDKAREQYYMTAADPAGSDPPEERLKKLLKAKYDAGLLKPFNYVKGYAKLNQYMERNLQPISRMKILKQLDKFRPKFRERVKGLTDMQLTYVEMHFERSLMEYDRVFASMAIPACCWRRTGEIYRGNKEMAELVGVSIDTLKDGKLAIHEIFAENSLVSYWEKFGAIAFDSNQKAILTTCVVKSRDKDSKEPEMRCCFSFTIRRDVHHIPSLIVGNFLQILPRST